ncbi:MAG: hypothetical protein Q9165_002487 [Trypethelium subeluteriae]
MFAIKATLLALVASTFATRLALKPRQSCVETCGSTCYWQSDIDAALQKGASLQSSGQEIDSYPHQYNDYEGFSFSTSSPWYEYPILSSYDVYTGGSPGADRVIFNGAGEYTALITHTGASGDDFLECKAD